MSVGATQVFASDEIDYSKCPYNTGYTWDFSTGSADSTYGEPTNTLTWYTRDKNKNPVYTPVTEIDQELVANQKILSMSQPVTLDSANDWTAEIVAKGDGTNSIKSVFSTSPSFNGAKFIFINADGDMCIGTGGDLVTNDGTTITASSSNYTYYKVSQEDYNNSILNDNFDVTQYHTYQMKCIGGVFSTWVDGHKIGNLSMSERNTSSTRSTDDSKIYTGGTGTHFDFSEMIIKSLGVGNSSGVAVYGLTATVKSVGLYPGHTFTDACDTDCNNEGCDYVREAPHSYDDGVVTTYPTDTEEGVRIRTCTLCGATKTESIPCVSNREHYVWDYSKVTDFDNPNIANTSGAALNNELSLVRTGVSGVTSASQLVSNGTLNLTSATTFKMSKSVKLNYENDWMIELVAQKYSTDTDKMGSFLSEGVSISAAKYFYITNSGDLCLVKKGSYTDDKGKSQSNYTYYKVSNDDFNNNMPSDFDVTEEHTYQVRCIDGRFSYWLDGNKIGDFALSEVSGGRGGSTGYSAEKHNDYGTPFWDDFKTITLSHVGCGSGNSPTSQALRDTKVKSLAIYPDTCELNLPVGLDSATPINPIYRYPGESVELPAPTTDDTCKEFLGWNTKIDGTGTMYAAGDNYVFSGLEQQGLFGIWKDAHDFGEPAWSWTGNDTDGYTAATATFTCSECQKTETVNATVTTAEPDGKVVYTATAEFEGETYTDQKTVFTDGVGATLAGHSISLEGDISVNFYMELSDEIADSDTAYMQFNIPNTSEEYKSQKVYVKDVEEKAGYYQFKCRVAAKDMKSEVTATIIDPDNDKEGTPYSYSVYQYAKYLIDHQDDNQTFKNAVPLVEAMITYGDNAAYYFDKTETEPAALDVEIPSYEKTVYDLPEGVAFDGATISLKSQTSLSLYFDSETQPALSCNDDGITYVIENTAKNEYAIRIRGIAAYDLDKDFTVKINGNDAVKYSPLAYCYKAQNSSDPKLANTVKALYLYWQAAQDYFG